MKSIKESGGLAITQDSESAKSDSMPRNAVLTRLVDYVLPVEGIPDKLIEYARHREGLRANLSEDGMLPQADDTLNQICSLLRRRIGHDFGNYKQGTLIRRIQRRIQATQTDSVEAYVAYLKSDDEEISLLFKDLLIGVTHFFRDPEAFDVLQHSIISAPVRDSAERESIRVWVVGCSSEEEVYLIAILLAEEIERQRMQLQVQIFASDIDEQALELARHARYPEGIAEQITLERLERFFIKQDGLYQVSKPTRKMCIFSQHSLINDPPFSRLDLISCRNLLIYFDSTLQKQLMPLFHYALRENGYLFLGSSENLPAYYSKLFRINNKSYQLETREVLSLKSGSGWPLYSQGQITLSASDSHLGYTLKVQQPITVEDFSKETRFSYSPLLKKLNLVSGISAIAYGPADEIYGVLASYRGHLVSSHKSDKLWASLYGNVHALFEQSDRFRMGSARTAVVPCVTTEEGECTYAMEQALHHRWYLLSVEERLQLGRFAKRLTPMSWCAFPSAVRRRGVAPLLYRLLPLQPVAQGRCDRTIDGSITQRGS